MDSKDCAIDKMKKIHSGKYEYVIESDVVRSHDKIGVICPLHGIFYQEYRNHLKGTGCKKCANIEKNEKKKLTTGEFINRSKEIHGETYDYSRTCYVNSSTDVTIICKKHGEFQQKPFKHLYGHGCPKCRLKFPNTSDFVSECKKIHGNNLTYENTEYTDTNHKVVVTCPRHGDFSKYPYQLINRKEGCPKCSLEEASKKLTLTTEQFKENYAQRYGNIYDLSFIDYKNCDTKIPVICHTTDANGNEHGLFYITPNNLMLGHGCPKCANGKHSSNGEKEIALFLSEELGIPVITNDKSVSGVEIDLYVPSFNIGIEYNGLYWHSEAINRVSPTYHLKKTDICAEHGIRLIHIFEDEWEYKKDIVKSRLRSIFGLNDKILYARNCCIKEIDSATSSEFIENNHLQGNVNASIRYGLYHNDELVAVMTFGKLRRNMGRVSIDGKYEMVRFCTKMNTTVTGAASKLLNRFISDYSPSRIISYSDKRWSVGNLYKKLGFNHVHDSKPNYFYVVGKHRENRFKYRKSELVKDGYDANKSEHEIMLERKLYRIYDCGNKLYEMKLTI